MHLSRMDLNPKMAASVVKCYEPINIEDCNNTHPRRQHFSFSIYESHQLDIRVVLLFELTDGALIICSIGAVAGQCSTVIDARKSQELVAQNPMLSKLLQMDLSPKMVASAVQQVARTALVKCFDR